jgi:hypothetical protein
MALRDVWGVVLFIIGSQKILSMQPTGQIFMEMQGTRRKTSERDFSQYDPLSFRKTIAAFNELHDLAIGRKELVIQDKDILLLRDMIQLMSSDWLNITYIRDSGSEKGKACLAGNYWVARNALRDFLSEHAHRADHFYVSGTLLEPYPNFSMSCLESMSTM